MGHFGIKLLSYHYVLFHNLEIIFGVRHSRHTKKFANTEISTNSFPILDPLT